MSELMLGAIALVLLTLSAGLLRRVARRAREEQALLDEAFTRHVRAAQARSER